MRETFDQGDSPYSAVTPSAPVGGRAIHGSWIPALPRQSLRGQALPELRVLIRARASSRPGLPGSSGQGRLSRGWLRYRASDRGSRASHHEA